MGTTYSNLRNHVLDGRESGLDLLAQQLHGGQHFFVWDQAAAIDLGQDATEADLPLQCG